MLSSLWVVMADRWMPSTGPQCGGGRRSNFTDHFSGPAGPQIVPHMGVPRFCWPNIAITSTRLSCIAT